MKGSVSIRGASLVLEDRIEEGDLRVEDGVIVAVGGDCPGRGIEEIDATGLTLMPGVIDAHVHFREPGLTHKEDLKSGSAAAVRGGVTAFHEQPNTKPAATSQAQIDAKRSLASGRSYAHYGFYIGATLDNLADLKSATRTPGIKIFVGSSTGNMLVDDQNVLEAIFAETRLPICVHAEEESLVMANFERLKDRTDALAHSSVRTPEAAARSVARVCDLAVRHEHRLHILHVSTTDELAALVDHPCVSAEICYPHLFLDTDAYERLGCQAKINPALRSPEERHAMWPALRSGRFMTIGSDHAPHLLEEKAAGYPGAPSGMPSVEMGLPLMLDASHRGEISLPRLVQLMCTNPAKVWNIPRKGRLAVGYDADLVLVDRNQTRVVRNEDQWTRCGWSAWHGSELVGWPVRTLIMGKTVVQNDSLVSEPTGSALVYTDQQS